MAQAAGFRIGPAQIWQQLKGQSGKRSHLHFILQLYKGKPVPSWQQREQLYIYEDEVGRRLPHALLTRLLEGMEDGLVIDPFMQDHSIASSTLQTGLRFSGAHADPELRHELRKELENQTNAFELMRQAPVRPEKDGMQLPLI
ncbi:hypothetical protein GCM10023333_34060 [Ferrimonas pelagia]|uniref:Uncharacterized protein n=2 Tax=Ferrimonas pelagia TaxID=1177826 RepID=A0ABP9FBL3_9GAMM